MSAAFEMLFCRRCGNRLAQDADQASPHVFSCQKDHTIYANASPAVALALLNQDDELLVLRRGIEPGKGELDLPGGFCDGLETLEDALARETLEETNIAPTQYSHPELICSGTDQYNFGGETVPVLSAVFVARCAESVTARPADDAESLSFVPLHDLTPDDFYFPSIRQALTILTERMST